MRHTIGNSKFFKKENEQAQSVELEKMLTVSPEAVYNSHSVNEPAFVRKYAPLPLQATYTDKDTIQTYIPEPSAPNIFKSQKPNSSDNNKLNKITSSNQSKSETHKCLGPHTTCSYLVGHGMVWEDLCRCNDNNTSA